MTMRCAPRFGPELIYTSRPPRLYWAKRLLLPVLPSSARLLLTVHDELVLECLNEDAKTVAGQTPQVMKEAFRDVFGDTVPVEVDAKICRNWGEKA
jgi:DNA polymerase I-like protein with 3'-5' exonuclease and polymerase domains